MSRSKGDIALLTPERLEDFLKHLEEKGLKEATIRCYRDVLLQLAASLPDGRLGEDTWQEWKSQLESRGLQPATVNKSLSALNSYYEYIGRKEWRRNDFLKVEKKTYPELSRTEYLRLLSAARILQKENAYLLLKLMGSFGVELKDLPLLTVKAIKAGSLVKETGERISFTQEMRHELMAYAQRQGIQSGMLFCTSTGRLMDRKHIHWLFSSICADAQVDPDKVSPRTVLRMYHRMRDEIAAQYLIKIEDDFQELLFVEQRLCGWEEGIDGRAGIGPARRNDLNLAR